MDLNKLRHEIDKIDNSLLNLIAHRLRLSKKVAEYKHSKNLSIRDKNREKEVINNRFSRFEKLGFNDFSFIKKLYRLIFKKSIKVQKNYIKELRKKDGKDGWW